MSLFYLSMLVAGALAGGFVNGLAGFGTALFALGFWLQILPPIEAVALTLATGSLTGVQGMWVVRRDIGRNKRRLARFLIPGLIGIPLGIAGLSRVDPDVLRAVIAVFLVLYGAFFLLRRRLPTFERPTPVGDVFVGVSGGILGGLAGLSGALPAMWCALRPWPRHETRAVLQPYNYVILSISLVTLAIKGVYQGPLLVALVIVLVVSVIAAQIGIFVFNRLSDVQFRWLLIGLMFTSGVVLMARVLA